MIGSRICCIFLCLFVAASLAGCSKEVADAKHRLEMVQKVGNLGEVCAAARAVADAYLRDGAEVGYEKAYREADLKCLIAKIQGDSTPAQLDRQEELKKRRLEVEKQTQAFVDQVDEAAQRAAAEEEVKRAIELKAEQDAAEASGTHDRTDADGLLPE